ncbi:hypothetical protein GCK72_006654 [Caenorhabditis remanei]|uniref:Domain of unknown function DX domain-containing protein n=1 Tax=Caenorhabditis remanei TaxID=31234 RepID=A0A6A5HJ34_CAERE|nr:hypothetical protein GCK72_006654 [Caenorhabditis remanei]KAF1766696.1 hypothetical protein GCK72_006654 [Caenorhabditis remanei]
MECCISLMYPWTIGSVTQRAMMARVDTVTVTYPMIRSNGDCATGSKCFFGDEDPSRNGSCRMIKDLRHNYFNAMFSDLISNSVGKIPADLFYPQSNKSCETSRNCEYSEVCMISAKNVSSNEEIQKHCYKKSPYWTTVPKWITDSIKPCNSNSQCSNNFCVKMGGKITKFESKTVWNTEKVIIWSPTIFENSKKTMKNATIFLDETDRKNRKWKLEVAGSEIFQKNMSGCFFSFQKLGDSHSTPIRIRSARLNCLEELDEAIYADIEIFGETLTTNTESMKFEGLCGHPGLNCINCLVDNQLFPCKEDRDCYDVGSRDWIIRNEKPSCSSYVYSGQRLCKREKFTCPPDSLNSDGAIPPSGKLCEADADCKNMTSFVDLPNLKANYYPHCFNGLCCARRELCVREDILPYALPVESNGESEACFKDEDCVMFPGSRGSCEVARLLTTKLSFRERFYINDSAKAYKYDYGMCCYNERLLCSPGTTPFEVELVDGGCSEHMDCNPYLKPFEWNSYCSENKTCCRGKTSEYMCPDGFTPYPNEPKCDGYNRIIEYSGNCPNENGMCYKGHCCPRCK